MSDLNLIEELDHCTPGPREDLNLTNFQLINYVLQNLALQNHLQQKLHVPVVQLCSNHHISTLNHVLCCAKNMSEGVQHAGSQQIIPSSCHLRHILQKQNPVYD